MSKRDLILLKEQIDKLKNEKESNSITAERLGIILEGLLKQVEKIHKELFEK